MPINRLALWGRRRTTDSRARISTWPGHPLPNYGAEDTTAVDLGRRPQLARRPGGVQIPLLDNTRRLLEDLDRRVVRRRLRKGRRLRPAVNAKRTCQFAASASEEKTPCAPVEDHQAGVLPGHAGRHSQRLALKGCGRFHANAGGDADDLGHGAVNSRVAADLEASNGFVELRRGWGCRSSSSGSNRVLPDTPCHGRGLRHGCEEVEELVAKVGDGRDGFGESRRAANDDETARCKAELVGPAKKVSGRWGLVAIGPDGPKSECLEPSLRRARCGADERERAVML